MGRLERSGVGRLEREGAKSGVGRLERYSRWDDAVTGVMTRKGELDSNWCGCWIVNSRCLETKVEIEGSGSDDSW